MAGYKYFKTTNVIQKLIGTHWCHPGLLQRDTQMGMGLRLCIGAHTVNLVEGAGLPKDSSLEPQ